MLTRVLKYALVVALSLECQVALESQVAPAGPGQMRTPPPVSGQSYRTEAGLEERSNYISGGILVGAGYIDNLYPGEQIGQTGETTILIQPRIAFDTTSARQHTSLLYNPSFILYAPTTALNEADQSALFSFQYRLSPRLNMNVNDRLLRSSTGFGQIGSGGISGSTQTTTPGVIVPFGDRFINEAAGGLSYQFSPRGMIGASGNVSNLEYPKSSQVTGLYNSDARGGGGFYNYRMSASQYLGATYEYVQVLAYPTIGEYDTQTDTMYGFYTIYVTQTFSLSVAGGPQYYTASHAPDPSIASWSPSFTGSMGWQVRHIGFAANYSQSVTGGGGLLGAFHSKSAGAMGTWQFARLWDAGLSVDYAINKNATPQLQLSSPGGHSLIGSLSLGRTLSSHARASLRYDRIQNSYDGVPSIASNPSSDRVLASFSWEFQRPVGR